MNIRTTIVCLPVQNLELTLNYYKHVFNISDIQIEEKIITVELPNLSLFLMLSDVYESYCQKTRRGIHYPKHNVGVIFSCALNTKLDVDTAIENSKIYGGDVPCEAEIDPSYGAYVGYISDPDGHIWELVHPNSQA